MGNVASRHPLKNAGPITRRPGILTCLLFCLILGFFNASDAAADRAAGKAKAQLVCQTCHGLDGKATQAMVANIGGEQRQYLVKQLRDYRSGKRQHEQMSIIAQSLSDEDIDNLAEWYSSVVVTFQIPE